MAVDVAKCFVEWKEQFVSKEKGNRVVHYLLKNSAGESVLAVVGTERSVRHMFYVVSDDFLNFDGADKSVHAGYRWRSRREVVNWLTSMLSKKHRQHDYTPKSPPICDPDSGIIHQPIQFPDYKDRLAKNLKGQLSDILWSGVAWKCGKQLKHYPAFSRNGVTIAIQSFVFVMAEEDNRHLAYLEDMYEDRKGQKKVKVRWFHYNKEVKGVITVRNSHPKEVFITPYAQVISVECVDGPAIVLTREHYEKCIPVTPQDLLPRVHLCFRQFKSNRLKPFKLSKLRGYFDQSIFSVLGDDCLQVEEFDNNVKVGAKRTRSGRGRQMLTNKSTSSFKDILSRKMIFRKFIESEESRNKLLYRADEKIELLCQDSGIRGCWFRCTVLQASRKQIKVRYDDLKDEDECQNLEEWVPAFRVAVPDRLGMRSSGRPTIRPALPHEDSDSGFEIGDPVDAWWSDGWWEGVLTGTCDSVDGNLQVYIPSECLFLNIEKKNLRISKDWFGGQWVEIKSNPDILAVISETINSESKRSETSPDTEKTQQNNEVDMGSEEGKKPDKESPETHASEKEDTNDDEEVKLEVEMIETLVEKHESEEPMEVAA